MMMREGQLEAAIEELTKRVEALETESAYKNLDGLKEARQEAFSQLLKHLPPNGEWIPQKDVRVFLKSKYPDWNVSQPTGDKMIKQAELLGYVERKRELNNWRYVVRRVN